MLTQVYYKRLQIYNSAASYTTFDQYIFFNDVRNAKVGILEKETGEIVWTASLPVETGTIIPAINVPIIFEDKLFVVDSRGSLHIFRKN